MFLSLSPENGTPIRKTDTDTISNKKKLTVISFYTRYIYKKAVSI